jgi:hypothetical protein
MPLELKTVSSAYSPLVLVAGFLFTGPRIAVACLPECKTKHFENAYPTFWCCLQDIILRHIIKPQPERRMSCPATTAMFPLFP